MEIQQKRAVKQHVLKNIIAILARTGCQTKLIMPSIHLVVLDFSLLSQSLLVFGWLYDIVMPRIHEPTQEISYDYLIHIVV